MEAIATTFSPIQGLIDGLSKDLVPIYFLFSTLKMVTRPNDIKEYYFYRQ